MTILTNWTRLFLVGKERQAPTSHKAIFLPAVLPWRIMWRGGQHRVILKERVAGEMNFLQEFPSGCTLDLLGGRCSEVADRHQGIWLYRFVDCRVNRSWIPTAGAFSKNEMGALTYWLEIDCTILTFMEDLKK